MVTTNAIQRVFLVRCNGISGTAFTVDINNRQYLVSAKHLFPILKTQDEIELFHDNTWKKLRISVTGIADGDADVIVLSPSIRLSPAFPLPIAIGGIVFGQDVYFLGFPYGLHTDIKELNRRFPMPLIKRACLSAQIDNNGVKIWLLDGFNNPGFSGGPVLFREVGKSLNSDLKIIGVISGYRYAEEPIFLGNNAKSERVRSNTGIIIAYEASVINSIVKNNPNGIEIK